MYWVRHQLQNDIDVYQIVCETVLKRYLPQTNVRRRVKWRSKGRVLPQSSHQENLRKTKLQILPGFFFLFRKIIFLCVCLELFCLSEYINFKPFYLSSPF